MFLTSIICHLERRHVHENAYVWYFKPLELNLTLKMCEKIAEQEDIKMLTFLPDLVCCLQSKRIFQHFPLIIILFFWDFDEFTRNFWMIKKIIESKLYFSFFSQNCLNIISRCFINFIDSFYFYFLTLLLYFNFFLKLLKWFISTWSLLMDLQKKKDFRPHRV